MENSEKKNQRQAKNGFVVRETAGWLLAHQDFVSDGARRLYLTMRSLADAKTGELAIPGRGDEERWIKPATIGRKAGMSEPTRLKYTKELLELGWIRRERKRVIRRIGNRLRDFRGVARYTVLPPTQPNKRISSTHKCQENATPEPQHSVSSTHKSSTDRPENSLLHTSSSILEEVGYESLSNNTTPVRGVGLPEVFPEMVEKQGPLKAPPQNWEKIPGWNLIDLTPNEKQELAQDVVLVAAWVRVIERFEAVGIQIDGLTLPNAFEIVYSRLAKAGHTISAVFIQAKIAAKAKKVRLVKRLPPSTVQVTQPSLATDSYRDEWHRQHALTIKLCEERDAKQWEELTKRNAEERAKNPLKFQRLVAQCEKWLEHRLKQFRDGNNDDWRRRN